MQFSFSGKRVLESARYRMSELRFLAFYEMLVHEKCFRIFVYDYVQLSVGR